MLHILSTCSLNSAALCDVGYANFRGKFPFAKSPRMKNILFPNPPRPLDNLHQTLQVASVDKSHQKLSPTSHLVARPILMLCHKTIKQGCELTFWLTCQGDR